MNYNIWRVSGDGKSSWGLGKKYEWLFAPIEASTVYEALRIGSTRGVGPSKSRLLNDGDVVLVASAEGGHDQCGLFRIEVPAAVKPDGLPIEVFKVDR